MSYCRAEPSKVSAVAPRPRKRGRFQAHDSAGPRNKAEKSFRGAVMTNGYERLGTLSNELKY